MLLHRVIGCIDDGGDVKHVLFPVFLRLGQKEGVPAENSVGQPYHASEPSPPRRAFLPCPVHDRVIKIENDLFPECLQQVPFYKIREEPLHIDHVGMAESPYERRYPCLCGEAADVEPALFQIGEILLDSVAVGVLAA